VVQRDGGAAASVVSGRWATDRSKRWRGGDAEEMRMRGRGLRSEAAGERWAGRKRWKMNIRQT
jgi:hypothetical protein